MPLIVLSILYVLGLIIPFLLLILPGIWLSVAWSVSYPALLAEGLGAGGGARALVQARAAGAGGRRSARCS